MAVTINPDSSIIGRTRTQPDTDSLFRRPSLKKKRLDNTDSNNSSSTSSSNSPRDIMSSLLSSPGATTPISSPADIVHHQTGHRRFAGPSKASGLSLAGSFPPPTPFNHPAAFPSGSAADPTKSAATSMTQGSEAPDYFAQQVGLPPPATSTFGGSALAATSSPAQQQQQHQSIHPPQPHRDSSSQDTSDPFSTSFGSFSTSLGRSPFSIPSGALSAGFSGGSVSRISLPPTTGRFTSGSAQSGSGSGTGNGTGLFGGVAMSARSSRQSNTSSMGSIAGSSIISGNSSGANSTSTSGMADELVRFRPIEPDTLASLLADSEQVEEAAASRAEHGAEKHSAEHVLIIDIRSSASYSSARIKSSINVCAPSTLLKRPGITLDHVEEEMLGSERDRRRFKRWREGPRRIRQKNHDTSATGSPSLSRSNSKSMQTTAASPHRHPASPQAKSSPTVPERPLHPHSSSFGREKASSPSTPSNSEVKSADMADTVPSKVVPASANGVTQIVVLDNDTARVADGGKPSNGGGASCLVGMLRKFEAAGFAGELRWLVGGFNKFAGCPGANKLGLIDRAPVPDGETQEDQEAEAGRQVPADSGGRAVSSAASNQVEDRRNLHLERNDSSSRRSSAPVQADADAANASAEASKAPNSRVAMCKRRMFVQPRSLPLSAFSISTTTSNPGASNLGDKGGIAGPHSRDAASACANPFFDNIRQNRELAHGVTERVPMHLPELNSEQTAALPPFLQRLAVKTESARAEELAQGFFSIEKAEQRRLMSTMQQHSAESGSDPRDAVPHLATGAGGPNSPSLGGYARKPNQLSSSLAGINGANPTEREPGTDVNMADLRRGPQSPFPFSIAAALERGADNRYDNIWTYEHSRVRLNHPRRLSDPNSNYINASFVQPAREFGCARTYIATQAPLPSTFEQFWMMCWEQNVRVIVMVTREHEAGRIQAHRYWESTCYGRDIRLRQIREQCYDSSGNEVHDAEMANRLACNANDEGGGGLFPSMAPSSSESSGQRKPVLIRRTMALSNASEPSEGEHVITQLQYVAWPDYTVPESPQSLLRLLDVADDAQFEAEEQLEKATPVDTRSYFSHAFNGSAAVSKSQDSKPVGPMLVHCSAGVGRTGTFIAVDCALDAIRRQRGRGKGTELAGVWQNGIAAATEAQKAASGATGQKSSPPSARRQRPANLALSTPPRFTAQLEPSVEDVAMEGVQPTDEASSPFDPTSVRHVARRGSVQPSESDFDGSSAAASPAPSSPEPSVSHHAPSPLPTPLRHLDSMRLSGASAAAAAGVETSSALPFFLPSTTSEPSEQAESPMIVDASASQPRATNADGPTTSKAEPSGEVDIVKRVVEVMREQRMSSVQTTRQYVFVYTAVLEGVLRELKAEGMQ